MLSIPAGIPAQRTIHEGVKGTGCYPSSSEQVICKHMSHADIWGRTGTGRKVQGSNEEALVARAEWRTAV
jgi:hypothetical protein